MITLIVMAVVLVGGWIWWSLAEEKTNKEDA